MYVVVQKFYPYISLHSSLQLKSGIDKLDLDLKNENKDRVFLQTISKPCLN